MQNHSGSPIHALLLLAALASPAAWAADAPADPCSLLSAADVSKALGHEFAAPQSSVAPRPYKNTAQGTDCRYRAKEGKGSLLFRVYFDASAAESADLQAKLKMFYGTPTPVPGVGDETYLDSHHALHARKGNVRFFLEIANMDSSKATNDKQLVSLANAIGKRI